MPRLSCSILNAASTEYRISVTTTVYNAENIARIIKCFGNIII